MNFKWEAISDYFDMPILVKINLNKYDWIYPNKEWQSVKIDIKLEDVKIATELFLIETKLIE